ncbi:hypothetical protein PISMIDRAFT_488343 [Pisolithus microcarpus 441]|uniref:Unplaced genomic scaffold scaffold_5, whole genome shotgun sequence n=1 Tax=Pisolithus microcarpus 441 TaxID=765257 RepID=A0A0C9ZJY0_9AGAM|nr:hypothetical protein PISMIDRAFT_488343 [Pisolithus microcarpus 441]
MSRVHRQHSHCAINNAVPGGWSLLRAASRYFCYVFTQFRYHAPIDRHPTYHLPLTRLEGSLVLIYYLRLPQTFSIISRVQAFPVISDTILIIPLYLSTFFPPT